MLIKNWTLSKKELIYRIFQAVCEEKSVDLVYTERLQRAICGYTLFKEMLKISDGSQGRAILQEHLNVRPIWSFKVLASEFVNFKQFGLICREDDEFGEGPQTKLHVNGSAILDVLIKNWTLTKKELIYHIFQAICKEKSVDLVFTKRLQMAIGGYTLLNEMLQMNDGSQGRAILQKHLNVSPIWSFKVRAVEFVNHKQFELICQENEEFLEKQKKYEGMVWQQTVLPLQKN